MLTAGLDCDFNVKFQDLVVRDFKKGAPLLGFIFISLHFSSSINIMPCFKSGKSTCSVDTSLIPGSVRFPEKRNGKPIPVLPG